MMIELPDKLEAALKVQAQAHGVSPDGYVIEVLERDLAVARKNGSDNPFHAGQDHEAERQWLAEHWQAFKGQWVALQGSRLLSAGQNCTDVYQSARRMGENAPFVAYVEGDEPMPFAGW